MVLEERAGGDGREGKRLGTGEVEAWLTEARE